MAIRGQFEEQLQELNEHLLTMGKLVEKAVRDAARSLVDKDVKRAGKVVDGDRAINHAEIEIEKKCFMLITLQQPVGGDLRRIATTLKVSTDLERMADHAVSIAKTTIKLKDEVYAKPLIDIPTMAKLVEEMVHDVLGAYIDQDKDAAAEIAKQDDVIDAYYKTIFTELIDIMKNEKVRIHPAAHLLLAAQFLERIGDYVTNICESIIYMTTGHMVELNT
jgi:phosphate transport system protein